jgi:6-pyruvoyltetrahydropterin/6-carboxytetrahydropterin synthase
MKIELKQQFQIEAARFLPNLPASHPCSRMHGHSFKITLTLVGENHPTLGWVVDYHEITSKMKPLLDQLDHRILNDVLGLPNPTSENLCLWLYENAKGFIPELMRVTVAETPTTECSYPHVY